MGSDADLDRLAAELELDGAPRWTPTTWPGSSRSSPNGDIRHPRPSHGRRSAAEFLHRALGERPDRSTHVCRGVVATRDGDSAAIRALLAATFILADGACASPGHSDDEAGQPPTGCAWSAMSSPWNGSRRTAKTVMLLEATRTATCPGS